MFPYFEAEAGVSSGISQVVSTTYKSNKAPSDVDIALDGSTFPRYKVGCVGQQEFFLSIENTTDYIRDQCCCL